MPFIRGFARFWYDFIVGDDWKIAAAVVTVLLFAAALVLTGTLAASIFTPLIGVLLMLAFVVAIRIDVRE
ncbi:MAG: rane protein [Dactylosporangium sp.]|jgi:hypothetical protein|nr:rane protein [Dactylosporangium sp.]